jgi:hypothetical protein
VTLDLVQPSFQPGLAVKEVTRMKFTNDYGNAGRYAGQVTLASDQPHQVGVMQFSNGMMYNGKYE